MRKSLFLICVLMAGVVILAGSFAAISTSERWVTAYYLFGGNSTQNYLVPVKILVDAGLSREDTVRLVFEMIKNPPSNDLYSVVPKDLNLLGVEFDQELATLNFTSRINEIGGLGIAGAFVDQLTWSILEIEGLEKVAFKVEGELVTDVTSEGIGVEGGIPKNLKTTEIVPFSRGDQIGSSLLTSGASERWVTAYYLTEGDPVKTNLVPVKILVDPELSREDTVRLVFEMIKNPPSSGLYTEVPKNLNLLSVEIDKELVTLDFTPQIDGIAGTARVLEFFDQLTWSILDIEGLEKMAFRVEGRFVPYVTAEGVCVDRGISKYPITAEIMPFSKGGQSINESSFYGKWQITRALEARYISALDEKQIDAIIGKELIYTPEMAQYDNNNICNNPFYEVTELDAKEFMSRSKVFLEELGIDGEKVIAIDIYEADKSTHWYSVGSYLLVKSPNILITMVEGVYFEMQRQ